MSTGAHESLATRLYRGDVSYDFLGRRRRWYAISGLFVLISIVSILVRGLHPSIDFKGGDVFEFPKNHHSQSDVKATFAKFHVTPEVIQTTGNSNFRVETKALPDSPNAKGGDVVGSIATQIQTDFQLQAKDISSQTVGSTWGSQIT